MRISTGLLMTGALIALCGCNQGAPGGPGTASPDSTKPMMGEADNTFALDLPMLSTKLDQGDTTTISVGIKRGTNFDQDVSLRFDDVPTGVSIMPDAPTIRRMDEKADITIVASDNASVGDFAVRIVGHPDSGSDATAELALSIGEREMPVAADIDSDDALSERDAYIVEMRAELDALNAKYEALVTRAASVEGDERAELEKKVAEARQKLDAAEADLEEVKNNPASDRWEKVKDGWKNAMDDLKGMFE